MIANHIGQVYGVAMMIPQYDIYLHIGGGFGIYLLVRAVLKSWKPGLENTAKGRWLILLGVLVVGLIWEGYEWYFDIAGAPVGTAAYYVDLVKDLINDLLGGVIALYLTRKPRSK